MKILFFYTELAEYFISCVNTLSIKSNAEIHIVKWSVNKEAPFQFSFPEKIKTYNRREYNKKSLVELSENISPDLIYCSGWMEDDYLFICKKFRNRISTIIGFDNHWKGTVQQYIGTFAGRILFHHYFSHCWVPGKPQIEFAKRLGFNNENILTGFYSCDYNFFHNLYLSNSEQKKKIFPHKLIFVWRYYAFKGIKDLWNAFMEIQNENPNDWELWCLGTGDIDPILHPKIKHFGFVQPKDMENIIRDGGVFVLPSTFEPWGVAVHEFSAAGFPLICSNEVGAHEIFLRENENGFTFKAGDINGLKSAMKKIISLPNEKLFEMGEQSAELAKQITPDKWADTLMSILKTGNRN